MTATNASMRPIARQVAHLTNRAARRAVAHATAAEGEDRDIRPAALVAAVQADDAAVRALYAARHHQYAELFGHLAAAVDAERRSRVLEWQAMDRTPLSRRAKTA